MIDLHTHILPGIDDGSDSLDSTLQLAEIALDNETDCIVATPHSNQIGRFENFCSEELNELYEAVCRELAREHLPLELYLGMEIFASDDMGEKIRSGHLISLNRSRYYLVEFHFDESPDRITEYLKLIFDAGGVPLIAHPERYYCVQEYPFFVYDWLRMGCEAQINKGSIFGRFGRRARECAHVLLDYDLVTAVASDAHSPYMRTTDMSDAQRYLSEVYGSDKAGRLLERNPRRILRDRDIPEHGWVPEREMRFYD